MIILLLSLLRFVSLPFGGGEADLHLSIGNVKSTEGMIWVGIYDSKENFMVQERARVEGYHLERTGELRVSLDDIDPGTYAVAVFHDENNNGTLDQNALGIPTEPYCFSRKPKSKWRAPRFQEVAVTIRRGQRLEMTLESWW